MGWIRVDPSLTTSMIWLAMATRSSGIASSNAAVLLARDGLHLGRTGINIFGNQLAELIQRALN